MSWPPKVGDLLPEASSAYNVREKLRDYSLNPDHPSGGPKAEGFRAILGITSDDREYLEHTLLAAIFSEPISEVRDAGDYGKHCSVIVPVRGVREHADRVAGVLTAWEIRCEGAAPRLITAYITSTLM